MIKISLTQQKFALIDDEDFELISKYKWCANNFYAVTHDPKNHKKMIMMHRLIMKIDDSIFHVHHKDENGLNNQKSNLQILTRLQHSMTMNSHKNSSSRFKGVLWNKCNNRWHVYIRINKKLKHLGCFNIEKDAAHQYDYYAVKYFKNFARLNFPDFDYTNFIPKKLKQKTSKYKGVSWNKKNKKWIVSIMANGIRQHLGYFYNEIKAAKAYDAAAIKYFGQFARINRYDR